jgi:hypothetical protein
MPLPSILSVTNIGGAVYVTISEAFLKVVETQFYIIK